MKRKYWILLANTLFGAVLLFAIGWGAKVEMKFIIGLTLVGAILGLMEGVVTIVIMQTKNDDKEIKTPEK